MSKVFGMLALGLVLAGCASSPSGTKPPAHTSREYLDVAAVLDDFHDAASKADEARYFELFAEDGVFLGTDDTERWTVDEFRAYAHPYFSKGQGWTYVPVAGARHIGFSEDGRTAWFDERLDNAKYGRCRGSGVLVWERGSSAAEGAVVWRIAQYNLAVPIPNELLSEVAERIRNTSRR